MKRSRLRFASYAFYCVALFMAAILFLPGFRVWVPFSKEHEFAYLLGGFVINFVLVLIMFVGGYSSKKERAEHDEERGGGKDAPASRMRG